LKKILIAIMIFCVSSTTAMAKVYVDLNGAYINTGDAETQIGFGGGLAFSLSREFNLIYRGMKSSATKDANDWNEKNYDHMMQMLGLEYCMPISTTRFSWKTSLLAGYSSTSLQKEESFWIYDYSDDGFAVAAWTGITFNATQWLSPFIDVGYHYSYYTGELQDDSISGLMVMAGVRICVWGPTKRIDDSY